MWELSSVFLGSRGGGGGGYNDGGFGGGGGRPQGGGGGFNLNDIGGEGFPRSHVFS